MDRSIIKNIRVDVEQAMTAIAEQLKTKYGVAVKVGNATYGHANAAMKLEFADIAADGSVATKEAEAFKSCAVLFGFDPDDLGRTFVEAGIVCKIVGLKPASRKHPVLVERGGKLYKYGVEFVKFKLAGDL